MIGKDLRRQAAHEVCLGLSNFILLTFCCFALRRFSAKGWINNAIEAFIRETFGEEKWLTILGESGVQYPWVSSCPFSDTITYK